MSMDETFGVLIAFDIFYLSFLNPSRTEMCCLALPVLMPEKVVEAPPAAKYL